MDMADASKSDVGSTGEEAWLEAAVSRLLSQNQEQEEEKESKVNTRTSLGQLRRVVHFARRVSRK